MPERQKDKRVVVLVDSYLREQLKHAALRASMDQGSVVSEGEYCRRAITDAIKRDNDKYKGEA